MYFDFKFKAWKEYRPLEIVSTAIASKPQTGSETKSVNRKRKLSRDSQSSEDDLFSECIFLPSSSSKKPKIPHDTRQN